MSEDLLHHMSDVACVRSYYDESWGPIHRRLLALANMTEHNGWKRRTGMTQHNKIINHMVKQGSITQREAMLDYSIQSFTKRISELREMGYAIVSIRKRHPVTGQEYTRYMLAA